jgi:hypothetical protein
VPLSDWEIQLFMKVKNSWVYQSSSFTAGDGSYAFQITQAGQYRIYEIVKPDWTQTKPLNPPLNPNNYYEINITKAMLTAGTPLGPYDFGNRRGVPLQAVLAGIKFNDANQNCEWDPDEGLLAGWLITITAGTMPGGVFQPADPQPADLTQNPVVGPWTVSTGADGSWEKDGLPRGWVYEVREEHQPGWEQTAPCSGLSANVLVQDKSSGTVVDRRYYVTVPEQVPLDGDDKAYLKLAFGNSGCGRIIVYKFEDHDSNGIQDGIDEALSTWTMFLYDANPPNSLQFPKLLAWGATMKDDPLTPEDETGYIEFPIDPEACLPFGTYIVAEMDGGVDWTCTTCTHGPLAIDVTITPQDPVALVEFGNHYLPNH